MKKFKYLIVAFLLGLFTYFPIISSKAEPGILMLDYQIEKGEDGISRVVCERMGKHCMVILM